jgi:hypothetical protein
MPYCMNPCDRIFVGPYTPPECVPWPQNEYEAQVLLVMEVVAWVLCLVVMLWTERFYRRKFEEEQHACEQGLVSSASFPKKATHRGWSGL